MPRIVDHDARRTELAAAACKAIARHGIDGVRLTDIGEVAGCTTGTICHYFSDKNAVVLAAVNYAIETMRRRMDARLKRDETDDLGSLTEALPLNRKSRSECVVWYNFWFQALNDPAAMRRQRAFHKIWLSTVEARLIAMRERGEIEVGEDIAEEVVGLSAVMNGIALRATLDPVEWPAERQIAQLRRYFDRLRPE